SRLYQPIDGSDFANPASGGLAVGSLSGSLGKIEAVIASFPAYVAPSFSAPNSFQYLVASNINLQLPPSQGQPVNTSRYKPTLPPPNFASAFDYTVGPNRPATVTLSAAWNANTGKTRINQVLLDEAFVFVPLAIALQLQRSGDFLAALDWFRSVFDYTAQRDRRVLYPGLELNPGGSAIWRAG